MTIRALTRADLPAVTAIHRVSFPSSAITALGDGAVLRFYDSLLTGPHDAVGFGDFDGDRLIGYCYCGVWHNVEVFFVRQNLFYLALRTITHPWLLGTPFFRGRLRLGIDLLFRKRPERHPDAPPDPVGGASFGIQSIAVDTTVRGSGVGKRLLLEAERVARERGFARMDLSVHPENTTAVRFYEGMGWTRFESRGEWRGFMHRELR